LTSLKIVKRRIEKRQFVKAIIRILFCVAMLGVALRVTFHDALPMTAVAYYVLTPMVIAIILATTGVLLLASHRPLSACATLFAALLMAVVEGSNQLGFASCASFDSPQLRVVTWNVGGIRGRPRAIRANVADVLSGFNADIVVLSEAPRSSTTNPDFWRSRFPGYSVAVPGDGLGLIIISRSSLFDVRVHELGRHAYLVTAQGAFHGRLLEIFLVDFPSNPRAIRQPLIQNPQLLRPPPSGTGRVLMGDFNTPRDSTWFSAYDGLYTNAFDQSGQGWRKTWPSLVPVLDIDHIWTAEIYWLYARRCRLSDHQIIGRLSRISRGAPNGI
jgi:endonuclease/exonuclease/phosphatase (EEP) superfamily protein YafD